MFSNKPRISTRDTDISFPNVREDQARRWSMMSSPFTTTSHLAACLTSMTPSTMALAWGKGVIHPIPSTYQADMPSTK